MFVTAKIFRVTTQRGTDAAVSDVAEVDRHGKL